MNCTDWQMRIATEDAGADVTQHLAGCEECRRFAHDLAANAAALRSMEPHPAAYAAVRARVISTVRRRKRFAWLWPAVAAIAAACVAVVWSTAVLRTHVPRPAAITYRIAPPDAPIPVERAVVHHRLRPVSRLAKAAPRAGKAEPRLTAIKMLTDDPDVVIIWLVNDEKEGGSL